MCMSVELLVRITVIRPNTSTVLAGGMHTKNTHAHTHTHNITHTHCMCSLLVLFFLAWAATGNGRTFLCLGCQCR